MQRRTRLAATAVVLASTGAAAVGVAGAPADGGRAAATPRITAKGVGQLKLGMRFERARELGLVRKSRQGCTLDDQSRSALLAAPLEGSVDLTKETPRRIARISVTGGAEARGVGVGDPLRAVKAAYPSARVVRRFAPTFGFWFVRVPRRGGGRLEFTVKTTGRHAVFQIDVPRSGFCE